MTPAGFHEKNTKPLEHEEDKTCDFLVEDSDVNNNSLATTAQKMAASAKKEPLTAREDRSGENVAVNELESYSGSKSLMSADFRPCSKKGEITLLNKEGNSSDVLGETLTITNFAHSLGAFTAKEPLATKERALSLEKALDETDISGKTHEESCNTSTDEQVPTEPSNQRNGSEEGGRQERKGAVCKCE